MAKRPMTLNQLIKSKQEAPTLAGVLTQPAPTRITKEKMESKKADSLPSIAPKAPAPKPEPATVDESLVNVYKDETHGRDVALSELAESVPLDPRFNILEGIDLKLDDSQIAAVHGLARETMGCLMGPAGSGKTTTMKYLLHTLLNGDESAGIKPVKVGQVDMSDYFDEDDDSQEAEEMRQAGKVPSIAFVAFTGVASQVIKKSLPDVWHSNVMTIHQLLGYRPEWYTDEQSGRKTMRFEPSYDAHNKFGWDIIIVDEASMVGTNLWNEVRAAAHDHTRFYFIGDLNQLAPTMDTSMYGYALYELPAFELTHIHRQADPAANMIVDAAHRILGGNAPMLESTDNPDWRFIGVRLPTKALDAHKMVVAVARKLSVSRASEATDPERPLLYVPERDRIITPTNGGNPENPGFLLGQEPLNDTLSQVFLREGEDRWVISYQRGSHKFAIGSRVMCLKNEPPGTSNRVTNGATGVITSIRPNPAWTGDAQLVGRMSDVSAYRDRLLAAATSREEQEALKAEAANNEQTALEAFAAGGLSEEDTKDKTERLLGPASHIIEVQYDSGAQRTYSMASEVENVALAYASTTHKAQGSECPTAIIIVHHLHGRMLTRENLYTAVTRASKRVVLLYTDQGLRLALGRQEIHGNTLDAKLKHFKRELVRQLSNSKWGMGSGKLPQMRPDSYYAQHGSPYEGLV